MEDTGTQRLAERLKLLRQEQGWSLEQLAERFLRRVARGRA